MVHILDLIYCMVWQLNVSCAKADCTGDTLNYCKLWRNIDTQNDTAISHSGACMQLRKYMPGFLRSALRLPFGRKPNTGYQMNVSTNAGAQFQLKPFSQSSPNRPPGTTDSRLCARLMRNGDVTNRTACIADIVTLNVPPTLWHRMDQLQ